MAKRKRLTPVPLGGPVGGPLETKQAGIERGQGGTDLPLPQTAPSGPRSRVPIAADAGQAAADAALAEMAGHLETARRDGRLALDLPVTAIDAGHLTRDRIAIDDAEMTALIESIAARGQQTPIDVVALDPVPDGTPRYGLISGWRRLAAIRHLRDTTGDPCHETVRAILRQPAGAAEAYLAMVEENEIRANLSHYERARIVTKTVRQGVYADRKRALRGLFGTASRPKRSKIGSFVTVVDALDDALRFPAALPERLGLALAKRLEAEPALGPKIAASLAKTPPETAEAEQALLRAALASDQAPARETGWSSKDITVLENHGRITLQGPGLTAEFRQALAAWLKAHR